MKDKKNILFSLLIMLGIIGCAPVPKAELEHKRQIITNVNTKGFTKITELGKTLEALNIRPIYVYIDKDGSRNMSGTGSGELPPKMRRLLTSILADFGSKVKVVDSGAVIKSLLSNPQSTNDVFILDGAITMYDKDIMAQSSGFNLGIDFGSGSGEGNSNSDAKDKDKLSMLGVDFYFRQAGMIMYKTTSQIDIRSTTRGYSFGISINNAGIGMSGYKTIKDGAGLSVRKLLQESMYDLVSKAIKGRQN